MCEKKWHDQNARERKFQICDQVLVLLLFSTNKLLTKRHEPYPVTGKIIAVMYEIDTFDHQGRKKVIHIKMLRRWNVPTMQSLLPHAGYSEEGYDGIQLWKDSMNPTETELVFGEQVSEVQRTDLQELRTDLQDLQDVFKNVMMVD